MIQEFHSRKHKETKAYVYIYSNYTHFLLIRKQVTYMAGIKMFVFLNWYDFSWIRLVKTVQIRSFFWSVFFCILTEYQDLLRSVFSPNTGKYGPEKKP